MGGAKMKANELRIGNYIQLFRKPKDESMTTHIISGIFYEPDIGHCISLEDGFVVNVDTGIAPIPLTEQWLKDFGCKKEYDILIKFPYKGDQPKPSARWVTHKLTSKEEINQPFLRFDGLVDIYYIHQLQNLFFAITGNELTKT